MTTATDLDAVLASILREPDEDFHREAFADLLEELGQVERAAFVRVQVELAPLGTGQITRHPDCSRPGCKECRRRALRHRERELWANGGGFGLAAPCDWTQTGEGIWCPQDGGIDLLVRRGFVEVVACTLAAWLEHGPALVRRHPITTVRAVDREPAADATGSARAAWQSDTSDLPSHVPYGLLVLMAEPDGLDGQTWLTFDTPGLAHAALSAACAAWARKE